MHAAVPLSDPPPPTLNRELAQVLRTGPFSVALHLAIEARGWSLERIQRALLARGIGVSLSTLSYWRRGRSRPERPESLRAVGVLEEILGLPPQSLATLLGPRRPRGRWLDHQGTVAPLAKLWAHPDDLARIYTGFPEAPDDHLTRLSVTDDYYVGPERAAYRLVSRMVVRADAERVARCLVTYWAEDRDGSTPAITDTRYCRVGRVRDEWASGFTVVELILDRVLRQGECAVLEYSLDVPHQNEPTDDYNRRFAAPARQYALSVVFDPRMLPTRCFSYQRATVDGPDRWTDELWPAEHTVQTVVFDLTPGMVGIRWNWD
ncbi:MAG: helix-turn-helix domain-containing protein [Micromonosporaceae bacterium]